MARDSIGRTFLVAAVLCIVCSVLVSVAAVALRPTQLANKELDRKKNILIAAGLYDPKNPPKERVSDIYNSRVKAELIDLATGEPVTEGEVNPDTYDPREAARKPDLSTDVEPSQALPGISRREKYAFVYQVTNEDGDLSQIVLPIYGKGLWSTLYGFIAVDADTETINGITFYQHGETPGLGGEVDNPNWKAKWHGKKLYDAEGNVVLEVIKGNVDPDDEYSIHQVDGLAGATITTRGVSSTIRYWLGDQGFGPYLEKLRPHSPPQTTTASTTPES